MRRGAVKNKEGSFVFTSAFCSSCVQRPSGRSKLCRSKLPAPIPVFQPAQTDGDIKYEVNGAPFDHVLTNDISDPTDEERAGLERRTEVSQLCSTEV